MAQQTGAPRRVDPAAIQAEIGLSDDQAAAIRKARSDARRAEIQRRADMQVARMDLHELLSAPTLDEAAIGAKVKTLAELESAAAKARAESQVALRRLVTPEQYQKMQQVRMRFGVDRAPRIAGCGIASAPARPRAATPSPQPPTNDQQ